MTPPATGPIKVVIGFLDGRRLRGFTSDFSPMRDRFTLFPSERAHADEGQEVHVCDLKAVFFVKEFTDKEHQDPHVPSEFVGAGHGRKLEVTFADGEHLVGTTEGYNPKKQGFFFFPANSNSNMHRVYVVNANAKRVAWLPFNS